MCFLNCDVGIGFHNSAVRKIINKFQTCHTNSGKVGEQKMADFPLDHLLPDKPPFTNTGFDYFGPCEVKWGWGTVKRYRVTFTCLTVRAVYIEVADSLDTDSCINAVCRFICRWGQVTILKSDNCIHFVAAERKLREAIPRLDNDEMERHLQPMGTKWIFNSPAVLIKVGSGRDKFKQNSQLFSDWTSSNTLQTIMYEVESIINGRPLTSVSDDINDVEPLAPDHLLLLKSQPLMPPGVFSKDDTYTWRRWMQVHYVVDLFCTRWSREYLRLLQECQKWMRPRRNFRIGDLVLLVDSFSPHNSWLMGRVIETLTDSDGTVQRLKVKTKSSILERALNKLCLLEEV